jgi:hypothetical protein
MEEADAYVRIATSNGSIRVMRVRRNLPDAASVEQRPQHAQEFVWVDELARGEVACLQ